MMFINNETDGNQDFAKLREIIENLTGETAQLTYYYQEETNHPEYNKFFVYHPRLWVIE